MGTLHRVASCGRRIGLRDDRLLANELVRRLAELLLLGGGNRRLRRRLGLSRGLPLPALLRYRLSESLALLCLALRFGLQPFRLDLGAPLCQGLGALLRLQCGLLLRFRLKLRCRLLLALAPRPSRWSRRRYFLLRWSLDCSLLTRLRLRLSRLGRGLSLRLRLSRSPCLGRLCLSCLCLSCLSLGGLRFLPRLATLLRLGLTLLRFHLCLL